MKRGHGDGNAGMLARWTILGASVLCAAFAGTACSTASRAWGMGETPSGPVGDPTIPDSGLHGTFDVLARSVDEELARMEAVLAERSRTAREHEALDRYAESVPSVIQVEFERLAVMPGAGGTCFGNQLAGDAHAERDALSSVMLITKDAQGQTMQGTAVVVAGSAPPGGHARMLTAGHMIARGTGRRRMQVFDSRGRRLGTAHEIHVPFGDSVGPWRPDVAVLEMDAGLDARVYDATPGLPLARVQSPGVARLAILSPAASEGGTSGSPVTDADGNIVGIFDAAIPDEKHRMLIEAVDMDALSMRPLHGDGRALETMLEFFGVENVGFASTLGYPALLSTLGTAGRNSVVTPSTGSPDGHARIVGFPLEKCVAYSATVSFHDGVVSTMKDRDRILPVVLDKHGALLQ